MPNNSFSAPHPPQYPSPASLGPKRLRVVGAVRHLFGMSGGLSYHFTAMRFKRLWKPFLRQVDQWLLSWKTPETEIIIFGASGGWTLPATFLARFQRVIIVEPDPSAPAILRQRFPNVVNWVMHFETDLLPWFETRATSAESQLDSFLSKYPNAAILFSNLLGQVPLIWPVELAAVEWEKCNQRFLTSLEGRNWASYHDLLSGNSQPSIPDSERVDWREGETLSELGARLWSDPKKNAVISDHGMDWLGAKEIGLWHIRPRTYHLIGFVKS